MYQKQYLSVSALISFIIYITTSQCWYFQSIKDSSFSRSRLVNLDQHYILKKSKISEKLYQGKFTKKNIQAG